MHGQSLFTTIDNKGVARLTMNRPDIGNALDHPLINKLCDEFGRISADEDVRAIILTGAGDVFCAGADLNMMKQAAQRSALENKDDARRLAHMLQEIYESHKPTIARINGPAFGAAIGMIAACDIAIATDDAYFALSEVRLGLIPAVISPFVLNAVGARHAQRYLLTGEKFNSTTARSIGLLHETCSKSSLDGVLDEIVNALLLGGPNAIREAKKLISHIRGQKIDGRLLDDVATRIAKVRTSPEGQEGVSAFLEKRTPNWVDRE